MLGSAPFGWLSFQTLWDDIIRSDPDLVDYIIPGNDDAIRSIKLITGRLGQRQFPLGRSEHVIGVARRERDGQRLRIGQADILGRKADRPAGDVHRILAPGDHAGQPVNSRVRIASADGFYKSR